MRAPSSRLGGRQPLTSTRAAGFEGRSGKDLFDLTGKGVMSPTQFDNAMMSLGIDKRPPKVGGPITKENFVSMARAALDEGM